MVAAVALPRLRPQMPIMAAGSYINCGDSKQPGVSAVLDYLNDLERPVGSRCDKGNYSLVNNYNPGYFGDGSNAYTDTNAANTVYTIPPSTVRTLGDLLIANGVSWAYYGDQWNLYLKDKYYQNPNNLYCNVCNFSQYATSIMTNSAYRAAYLKDTTDLYAGIKSGNLPAVSFVKPSGLVDGHPASSKMNLFEGFVKKILDGVKNSSLWTNTAILVIFDEGGGFWDSGYVQPVDFFGDGTRIPLIVVSKYSQGGRVSHEYSDHASIPKFIERNWDLPKLSTYSRDNLPNPKTSHDNPYVPQNRPALGDLFGNFQSADHGGGDHAGRHDGDHGDH